MKTFTALIAAAVLFTLFAWASLNGQSIAAGSEPALVPLAEPQKQTITTRRAAPLRQVAPLQPPAAAAPSALQAALEAGNLCEVTRLTYAGNITYEELLAAQLATMGASPALLEAYGSLDAKTTSKAALFARAMRLGGFSSVPGTIQNPAAALEILTSLGAQEPGNAAYPFFLLAIDESPERSPEKKQARQLELIGRLESASYFDTHQEALRREFKAARWQSPAMYAAMLYSGAHTVYLYRPLELWKSLAQSGKFSGLARLADMLVQEGLRSRDSHELGGYDQHQYYTGQYLAAEIAGIARYPDASALEAETNHPANQQYPENPWITDPVTGERRCDPGPYENFFFEARESR